MSALTASFENTRRAPEEIRIAAAAVKNYCGGAAGVIIGTGYATPLVPATAGMQFIGVYTESNDNSNGVAGTFNYGAPLSGLSPFVRVYREGIFAFNQSGLTQANVNQQGFFSDDNTITTVAGACPAGLIAVVDEQNGLAWVDIANAVMPITRVGQIALAANTAISPRNSASYVITKAGVEANTLAAPTATTDDGVTIQIFSSTANAHTLTATGLLMTGTASVNVATFAAQPGAGLTLQAYQGKWAVLGSVGITFS